MQYTRLGRTGLKVSRLCLGTMAFGWAADKATSHHIMDAAVDLGINFFDTADIYAGDTPGISETIIGEWLKTKNRREIIIATKVRAGMWQGVTGEGLSRHHIIHAVEDSLRRLQTDYIDIYQTHWFDSETTLEETLRAMDDLIRDGKVLYAGASNYPAWLLMKSYWISDVRNICRFETLQPRYSLLIRESYENQLMDVCRDQQIGVMPFSPLASGFLTGKYSRDKRDIDTPRSKSTTVKQLINNEQAYDVLDKVAEIADSHSTSMAHVALAWVLAKDTITSPIIGVRTVDQLTELIGCVDLTLSEDELKLLDDMSAEF